MTLKAHGTVSTQEAAAMLRVAETTVKRWADEGTLPCVRTPGGHRKFLLSEIAHFAEQHGLAVGGAEPPELGGEGADRLRFGVQTRNYPQVADAFRTLALQADRESILALLLYLYKEQVPLRAIVDEIMRPAFEAVGSLWEAGELEISREHAATQATTEALVRAAAEVHRKHANGRSAVCACTEDELHELGLRGVAYSLEAEGWRVHYLGANTPAETLRALVRAARPDLVCLSMTSARRGKEFFQSLARLVEDVRAYGGKVVAGGRRAAALQEHGIACDLIAGSIQEAIEYTRNIFGLKPGPKRKHGSAENLHHHTHP